MSELLFANPGSMQTAAWEMTIAKNVGDMLNRVYPGYLWAVNVRGGIIHVKNLYLSGKWGFTEKLPGVYSASSLEATMKRGAGEILERYKSSRQKFKADEWAGLKKNFAGHFEFDK